MTPPDQKNQPPINPLPVQPLTVLVVEDFAGLGEFIKVVLQQRGYRVLTAADAEAAMAIASTSGVSIDLLVSDLVLPGRSGLSLAATLKVEHPRMRVLFITGYSIEELQSRHIPVDASAVLRKPVSRGQILARVREILDAGATT